MDQGHAHLEVLRGDTSFVLYRERTPEGEPFQLILALKPGVAQSDRHRDSGTGTGAREMA